MKRCLWRGGCVCVWMVCGVHPPCVRPSKWEDMAAFMPARGGGDLVKKWKEGASLNRAPTD